MINYPNPSIKIQNQSSGVDLLISKIQQKLQLLTWLQSAFGRALVQTELTTVAQQGATIKNPTDVRLKPIQTTYPEGIDLKGEAFNLMPNDNLKSYCFFIVRDPTTYPNADFADAQQVCTSPISIIFWANISKTEPNQDIRVNEKYKADVIKVLKQFPDFLLKKSFDSFPQVFDLFTLGETYRYYMKKPYIAFRIDGELTYTAFLQNNCQIDPV